MLRLIKDLWKRIKGYRHVRKCEERAVSLVALVNPTITEVRNISDDVLGCKIIPETGGVKLEINNPEAQKYIKGQ